MKLIMYVFHSLIISSQVEIFTSARCFQTPLISVRFEVLTATSMKMAVFWEAVKSSEMSVNIYQTTQ
jgi:hypothetical protein